MSIDVHFKPHLNNFASIFRYYYDTFRLHTITLKRCQESWDTLRVYKTDIIRGLCSRVAPLSGQRRLFACCSLQLHSAPTSAGGELASTQITPVCRRASIYVSLETNVFDSLSWTGQVDQPAASPTQPRCGGPAGFQTCGEEVAGCMDAVMPDGEKGGHFGNG